MASHISKFLDRVEKHDDLLLAKVLRNISTWTKEIQNRIHEVIERDGDVDLLIEWTRSPSQFVQRIGNVDSTNLTASRFASKYRSAKLWNGHVTRLMSLCRASKKDDILIEMIGIMANLTLDDIPVGSSWAMYLTENRILPFAVQLTAHNTAHNDFKLEALIFSRQICADDESARLIASSRTIPAVYGMRAMCDIDVEFSLQLLFTFQVYITFQSTRDVLLAETGKEVSCFYIFQLVYQLARFRH